MSLDAFSDSEFHNRNTQCVNIFVQIYGQVTQLLLIEEIPKQHIKLKTAMSAVHVLW